METNLEQRMKKYARKNKRKKIWMKILSVLSAVVVFCTTYALILPAITQERETFCGKEEHIHSESCFGAEEKVLVCELSEEEAHFHTEECSENLLVCETEENHLHSEECYSGEGLICEKTENHIHSEECYESSVICEIPETEGHSHTEECYETKTVSCEAEEHSHNLECYSDETADVETEEQWTASFASEDIGETVSENLIKIAKSQLGYHESTKNYVVLEDGETIKGRSRYGEWYGEPYADWNLLFTGFCLEYAKAEITFDADIEKWIEILSAPETDIYRAYDEHEALPGDLVFFDENGDGKPERTGIIIETGETEYKTVIGDYGDGVQSVAVDKADGTIIGFAAIAIPSPYHCGFEEHIHGERCFDEDGNLFCGFDEHMHNESCLEEKQEESSAEAEENGNEYICGKDEHAHSEECYGEGENLICEAEEHIHTEECLAKGPEKEYICGYEEHTHTEECSDENGNLVCETEEHTHNEECLSEGPAEKYFCGTDEHEHSEECYDEDENLICEAEEHIHTEECKVSFESLPEEERVRIEEVIAMIEALPTADEIDAKIIEFEDAEDYEGEEAWLTEIYQKVGFAYKYYMDLPESHRKFVTNSEKLMELEYIWSVAFLIETEIGKTVEYSAGMFNSSRQFIIYTLGENGYYAISGSGGAIPINITEDGTIVANVSNRNEILWSFTSDGAGGYRIRSASSGRYLHAFGNNGSGVTTTNAYSSFVEESSGGVKLRSNTSDYIRLDEGNGTFRQTSDPSGSAVYNFGINSSGTDVYVWLDGTWGGMEYLSGSENSVHTVVSGGKIILPTEWKTPDGYHYKIRGWYDIIGKKYYEPGAEATITQSTVFYPDWVPYTYDIGQYNAYTANTVSTSEFITTKVYDYNPFFNLPYVEVDVTVNASGHSETWNLPNQNDFIFRDWNPGKFTSPNNGTSGVNGYTEYAENSGIINSALLERLFGPEKVLGKSYIGTGDHLFQYCDDPANTEYYGYYYYDSNYHAASYNQSAGRFYIYDYLSSADTAHTSDFLPFNSPYVNTNGRPVETYSDNGEYGEYVGTTHYEYAGGTGVTSEYWFGMQTDIEFYLANTPGGLDSDGNTVNRGINGEELVFEFTGDDDVWVFVDGKLVLDIGGIHQAVSGSINFSTGKVYVNGAQKTGVTDLAPGEHTLTMYYLERGAGESNCRIKFNISTRYGLTLMKEDILTRELLNGAEFTVYTNKACSESDKASLWTSHAAYEEGEAPRSTFAVVEGKATFWGLAAGNTYYIKETKYPTNGGYGVANGIIVMKLNSKGQATFEVIPDPNGNGSDLTSGFTVHGFKIDVENHEAYLVATNGKEDYGDEVTSVTVKKEWADNIDHSKDSVTVYILANGFRIQEAILNENNDWTYTWKNLPVKGDSGKPVEYTVEEGTVPGYIGTIGVLKAESGGTGEFKQVSSFTDGKKYLIISNNAPLYATESEGIRRNWNISIPQFFTGAKWTADVNGNTVSLTNELGLTLYYSNSGGNRFYSVSKSPPGGTNLSFVNNMLAYNEGAKFWYMSWSEGKTVPADEWGGPTVVLYEEISEETVVQNGFLITNEPVSPANSVSFKVNKVWNTGNFASAKDYEQLVVTMKLLENGKDSGTSAELSLKNGWTYTFKDLPKYDSKGKEIVYSVEEVYISPEWRAEYGEITLSGNIYETTVINVCNYGYILPETGGGGNIIGITGGIVVLTASSGLIYRQKFKKRRKEDDSS